MAKKAKAASKVNEKELSKGQMRKLNALRKSLGPDIADKAFAQWLVSQPSNGGGVAGDKNAEKIGEVLSKMATSGQFRIPRGGYILRRGRGRVIVERPSE